VANIHFLYHGSTIPGLKILEPRKRYTPSKDINYEAIYATPIEGYAAAHSFPWSTDEGVDLDVIDDKVIMLIPKSITERLMTPVSIYKISSKNFEHLAKEVTGQTWQTIKPCKVISEEKFSNVLEAFNKHKVSLKIT
jgi:hypothetical protein